jgi:hypothetical protein
MYNNVNNIKPDNNNNQEQQEQYGCWLAGAPA